MDIYDYILKISKNTSAVIFILIVSLVKCSFLYAENKLPVIGILYPEVSKEYNIFFESIIEGIELNSHYHTTRLRVNSETSSISINQWIINHNIDSIIALGQLSYSLATKLDSNLPVVAGGLIASPGEITGISLSGEPEEFFKHLKSIAPKVKRIHIVYNEKNNGWIIQKALKITGKYNIGLVAYSANDLKTATRHYKKILENANSEHDSIWIPLDNVSPMKTILPEILQKSWDNKLVVFSNNLHYTKRGILFSLYPDNLKLGKRLTHLMDIKLFRKNNKGVLLTTKNLKIAVNKRTASHLGLKLKTNYPYDRIYPAYK